MAQKTVKTRIRQKHETAANWQAATGFKPLAGELIVYDADSAQGPRLKIGDETTIAADLPFVEAVPTGIFGVCETAADISSKTVTIDGFKLKTGAIVVIKFRYANSVASPTLNVNGTGDFPMYRTGASTKADGTAVDATAISTSASTSGWAAGAIQMFIYDGNGWVRDYWTNSTYSTASLGQGYCTCSTAASTAAKTASLSSYSLTTGGIVSVKFTNAVPANATLNINSKGAKNIYFRGAKITADVIKAGDIATFIYSSYYHLISIDRWQTDINGKSKVGHGHGVTTANAAPHTHTHSVTVSGTTGNNSGTAVAAVTGYGSFSGGSGSLKSYDASTSGNVKTSSGRVPYIADVTHTAASLTGTTTFVASISGGSGNLTSDTTSTNGIKYVEAQGAFTAGTTPPKSAAPTNTSTNTGSSSGTTGTIASYSNGVLTINATVNSGAHTHTYDKTTAVTLTAGTAPSMGAATTKYLHHTHTAASGTNGTVGISGGSVNKTTYYLEHAHTGASLGSPTTANAAPHTHTHSYGSSTALTTGNNSGTAVAAVTAVSASTD
jgi:hypothetical protein